MRTLKKFTSSGQALVTVLILLVVLGLGVSLLSSSMKKSISLSTLFRKRATIENVADSGLNLAKKELVVRSERGDCGTASYDRNPPVVDSPFTVPNNDFHVQYWYEFINESAENTVCNIDNLSDGTKQVKAIIEVENKQTGNTLQMEALYNVQRTSFANITLGILNPRPRDEFRFQPGTYDGHVHFGPFEDEDGDRVKPYFQSGHHHFKGPVTFAQSVSEGEDLFRRTIFAHMVFERVLETGYELEFGDISSIFSQVAPTVTDNSTDSVCLLFHHEYYYKYNCDDPLSVNTRYGAQISGPHLIGDGLVYYAPDATVGVKGFYRGGVTIAAKNIELRGDFLATDQANARYTAGLIAKENIIIPASIPTANLSGNEADRRQDGDRRNRGGTWWDLRPDALSQPASATADEMATATNFVITESNFGIRDRDYGNNDYKTTYTKHWTDGDCGTENGCSEWMPDDPNWVNGRENFVSVLDIEAAMIAIGETSDTGMLDIQNLNNVDPAYDYGVVVPDDSGNVHDPACDDLYNCNSLDVPTSYAAGLTPQYCTAPTEGPNHAPFGDTPWAPPGGGCEFGREVPRQLADTLWVTGTTITKDYSYTQGYVYPGSYRSGFLRKQYIFNPELLVNPPPSFPRFAAVEIIEAYRKIRERNLY